MKEINLAFNLGGLGDKISWLSLIKPFYRKYQDHILNLFVFDYFYPLAINYCCDMQDRVKVIKWSEKDKHYNPSNYTVSFKHRELNNLSMNMAEHAYVTLFNSLAQDPNDYNYPLFDTNEGVCINLRLPKDYVVVTTAFTAPVREFSPEVVNQVVNYLVNQGLQVVFMGQRSTDTGSGHVIQGIMKEEIDFSKGIDLIDKTTLLEAVEVLNNAKFVVGLDNGLLHLAASTMNYTPIVAGFTTVDPDHRKPYRKGIRGYNFYPVVPPESLACRFCQSNMVFLTGHDFRNCYTSPDNKDISCVKQLTADLYIEQIKKLL
jgi:ADP-heptose:LPS heptosyltransferase